MNRSGEQVIEIKVQVQTDQTSILVQSQRQLDQLNRIEKTLDATLAIAKRRVGTPAFSEAELDEAYRLIFNK